MRGHLPAVSVSAAETIAELRASLTNGTKAKAEPELTASHIQKQHQPVPVLDVVAKNGFLVDCCRGQVVVDVGASGYVSEQIRAVAKTYYGLNRTASDGVEAIDLDAYDAVLPPHPDATVVVCGEVLEHLSNPGWLLDRLKRAYPVLTLVTVPNAFSEVGLFWLNKGIENVNREHVAYYSYHTITGLLTRHGYRVERVAWYRGHPKFAEGLVVVAHG